MGCSRYNEEIKMAGSDCHVVLTMGRGTAPGFLPCANEGRVVSFTESAKRRIGFGGN